jgi:putative DNA primase/helicase
MTAAMLADNTLALILTEGFKKVLALQRLASDGISCLKFLPVGLSGCWNWRGTVGRQAGPDGHRRAVKGPIPDLARISWQGRTAVIIFDSDKRRNSSIQAAERALALELKSRGAAVKIVDLPDLPGLDKTGADDYLAHPEGGPERMLKLIDQAAPFEPDLLRLMYNDHGNAQRIVRMYGDDLRYCHKLKKWLAWDGRRWAVDETGQAAKLAKLAMLEFVRQAVEDEDEEAEKYARSCLNQRLLKSALESAETELPVGLEDLDRDPYALNFLNGTVDLRTGELRGHERAQYITKLVHYDYMPEAECPQWKMFLYRIMGVEENEERAQRMLDWLQKALGVSITADTSEKAFFVCHGRLDNGKTTMLSTVRALFEEYSAVLQVDSLMYRREETNNAQADLADLRGARFAMTSETEDGQRLSAAKIKRITQGRTGRIKTARKYENPVTFAETHHLWMDANFKPHARANDDALWSRVHLIPFEVIIPKHEQDRDLPAKLLAEAEGIIGWAVEGARRWFTEGLGRPLEVIEAGKLWRAESDALSDFVSEMCEMDPDGQVGVTPLWEAYERWAAENADRKPLERSQFNKALADRGCKKGRDMVGRFWRGIRLRNRPDGMTI